MIGVIVPSRGRPGNVRDLIDAWSSTADGHAELIVAIDDDDPTFAEYVTPEEHPWVHVHHGPRRRLGGTLNHLAPFTADRYDVVGFMGDDHRPRTRHWDAVISCQFGTTASWPNPPVSVVYGNDLLQGPNLPTAVFLDARIIRTLGWMVIPGMTHLFMDNLWKTIGEQLGSLRYLPDVIIEHLHPLAGRAEWDQTYTEANHPSVWSADEALYRSWMADRMPADVARLKEALK